MCIGAPTQPPSRFLVLLLPLFHFLLLEVIPLHLLFLNTVQGAIPPDNCANYAPSRLGDVLSAAFNQPHSLSPTLREWPPKLPKLFFSILGFSEDLRAVAHITPPVGGKHDLTKLLRRTSSQRQRFKHLRQLLDFSGSPKVSRCAVGRDGV